ncbi:MAG: SEL1-like repeat protein [Candidatus Riflebacteria bacterium]|nr:SEL1-like repeat protein [Candidatus Riflebacteria bacterium]
MVVIDTPDEICVCGGKLTYIRDAPNRVSAKFAPQDEIWLCKVCAKYFIKTWHAEHIDYYTENADYDAHFQEVKSDHRYCVFCNASRRSENPVFLKQPVCKKCFILKEWEEHFKRGEVAKTSPSDSELSDFLDGETALEAKAFKEAFAKFKPFAEVGFSLAELHLGEIYESGPHELQNFKVALEWYKKAAEKRLPKAFFRIGKLLSDNRNSEINLIEAYKWLNLGVYFGDFSSFSAREAIAKKLSHEEILRAQDESSLALKKSWKGKDCRRQILENLKSTVGEHEGSLKYASILDGSAFQMFLLDYRESERLYLGLVEEGYLPAMSGLGEKLAHGKGVPKNLDEAAQLLTKSISRKYYPAVEFAWNEIASGSELKIDLDWLKTFFLAEIEAGNSRAMYCWGVINKNGTGIPKNLEEAYKWLNLAQYLGEKLPRSNPMDSLEIMPFEQLANAQYAAQEWLESHQGKIPSIRKFNKYFRERVMTNSPRKWFKFGQFFQYGREGFLRNLLLAYGCFELALTEGDAEAKPRVDFLVKIIPPRLIEKASEMALSLEKTGCMPDWRQGSE